MTHPASIPPHRRGLSLRRLSAPIRAWAAARALPDGVHDPAFRDLVRLVDRGVLHQVPPLRFLTDGEQAFARMYEVIAAAHTEVLVETYILRDDRLGQEMHDALTAAAARGVRVHVLADAYGSFFTRQRFWDSLAAGGVQVRRFQRLWTHPLAVFRRDHRKLLIVDRVTAFTGGMNIGEEYGSSIRSHVDAWRDTFVEVAGDVAEELAAVFAEGWDRAGGAALPGLEYVSWSEGVVHTSELRASVASMRGQLMTRVRDAVARRRDRMRDRMRGRRVRRAGATGTSGAYTSVPDVPDDREVLVLDPRPGRGQREMLVVLAALVGAARERLWITTPYFAPPSRALRLLVSAAQRGVDVRLLLPSERTDVPLVRHAAHGAYTRLLRNGVRIFEYSRATLHAKTLVVDGHAGLVGSSNLDFRSFWLNAECNLLCFDDGAGASLERTFLADLEDSTEITADAWRQRTWWHRQGDRFARAMRWAL